MPKLILILIDGCRSDALQQAQTPAIDNLMTRGASTLTARTVEPSMTLPAHFSLFTSLPPLTHNVTTNTGSPIPSNMAHGLVELLKYNGYSTAAAYSWEPLRNLAPPTALDAAFYLKIEQTPFSDLDIMMGGIQILKTLRPDFLFIYLEGVDVAGHASGWMSEAYLAAVATADKAVGLLLQTLAECGEEKDCHLLLQADHGGEGKGHQITSEAVLTIPWVVSGPDIRPGHRIGTPVSILDTAPTIARLMQMPAHYTWEGRAPEEIFAAGVRHRHRPRSQAA
jgi:predicted AlkP superfamily pyrophosphatase or phosphodiesterase